jgi:type II secretory pathway pseudopilin PulG
MKAKKNLSLIELILVIGVIGVIAGFMLPMLFRQRNKASLETALHNLLFDIRLAQQLSLAKDENYEYYGIRFYDDLGGGTQQGYKILRYEPQVVALPIADPPAVNPTVVKGSEMADNPLIYEERVIFPQDRTFFTRAVTFSATTKIGVDGRIIFTPQGSATTDGETLFLDANCRISLQSGNFTGKIIINPLTGYAEVGYP